MALIKSSLRQKLESVLDAQPKSADAAGSDWANAYLDYASLAMSSMSSLPVTASASLGLLVSAFTAGFQAQGSSAAGAQIAQGVSSFWSAQAWVGPGLVGTTASPGNEALASSLSAIFADTSGSNADKASALADAFDSGAKSVMVSDVSPVPVTVVGPIS